MKILILRCSLNSKSRSAIMAAIVQERLKQIDANLEVNWLDIRSLNLPMCDGESVFSHPGVVQLRQAVQSADGIVIATPIYNYNVASSTKNCLDLVDTWHGKALAMVYAAGGPNSYMAGHSFVASIVSVYRMFVLPRFVQAPANLFKENELTDPPTIARLTALAQEFYQFTGAVQPLAALYVKTLP